MNNTLRNAVVFSFFATQVLQAQLQWQYMGAPQDRRISFILFEPSGKLFAATDSGLYASATNGSAWTTMNTGFQLPSYPSIPPLADLLSTANGTIYAATGGFSQSQGVVYPGKVFRSTDLGASWTEDTTNTSSDGYPIALGEGSNGVVFAVFTTYGIYARSASGSWTNVYSGNTISPSNVQAIGRTSNTTILASGGRLGQPQLIMRSSDNGTTWTKSDTGYSGYPPACFGFSQTAIVYAALGPNVHRSTDDGRHWASLSSGLPSTVSVRSLLVFSDRSVFAATTNDGVYRLAANDTTWHPVNNELSDLGVSRVVLGPDARLYASTPSGVFRSTNPLTSVLLANFEGSLLDFELLGNYPNPFNAATAIDVRANVLGNIKVQVFNVLGQPVKTLVDRTITPGTHQYTWDASTMPSGTFFYRLEAGGLVQIKRMLLLK